MYRLDSTEIGIGTKRLKLTGHSSMTKRHNARLKAFGTGFLLPVSLCLTSCDRWVQEIGNTNDDVAIECDIEGRMNAIGSVVREVGDRAGASLAETGGLYDHIFLVSLNRADVVVRTTNEGFLAVTSSFHPALEFGDQERVEVMATEQEVISALRQTCSDSLQQ